MAKKSKNSLLRYKKNSGFNIGHILFFLILIYLIVLVIDYTRKPKVHFYEVIDGNIVSNNTYTGFIVRNEEVQLSPKTGYINYYIREGKHTKVGGRIYSIDETGNLKKFIAENGLGQTKLSESDISELKRELAYFSKSYADNDFVQVYESKYIVNSKLLEYENLGSVEGLDELIKQNSISYEQITSPYSGTVSFITDGFEDMKPDNIDINRINSYVNENRYIKEGELAEAGTPIYKVVVSEDWSIVFALKEEEAKLYEDSKNLKIKFDNRDLLTYAGYETFTGNDGTLYGKLSIDKYVVNFLKDRLVNFEIETNNSTGLKIPKKAITTRSFFLVPKRFLTMGGNGIDSGFNKEVYTESGTSVVFTPTDIYNADEENYYLSSGENSELKEGDYIVAPDTGERYQLGLSASLEGVYNINKGFAVFKLIKVLNSNDEYYIVEKNTKYGLNVYDHILLSPENVNENDFIYR